MASNSTRLQQDKNPNTTKELEMGWSYILSSPRSDNSKRISNHAAMRAGGGGEHRCSSWTQGMSRYSVCVTAGVGISCLNPGKLGASVFQPRGQQNERVYTNKS